MTIKEKLILLQNIMDLGEGDLEPEVLLEDLEEWDSIARLSFLTTVKKISGKTMTVQDFENLKTVQDICDYLE